MAAASVNPSYVGNVANHNSRQHNGDVHNIQHHTGDVYNTIYSILISNALADVSPVRGQNRIPDQHAEQTKCREVQHAIPFSLHGIPITENFLSRATELNQLEAFFKADPDPEKGRLRTFVIHGMAGLGKTSLAVEFARRNHSHFSAVFWMDASSKNALLGSLADCARRVLRVTGGDTDPSMSDVSGLALYFTSWLSEPLNSSWLLILDNIDQAYDYRSEMPQADHGNIILTTRLQTISIPRASLQLTTLDEVQARELLELHAGKLLPDCKELLWRLDGLSLALVQAGTYMKVHNMTARLYLSHYERAWSKLMTRQTRYSPSFGSATQSLVSIWMIAHNQIVRESHAAASLLQLWAFVDNHGINHRLFAALPEYEQDPRWLRCIATDELEFEEAMGTLLKYSMASVSTAGSYSIHPVIHDWTADDLIEPADRHSVYCKALAVIFHAVPKNDQAKYNPLPMTLLAHAEALTRHAGIASSLSSAKYLTELGRYLYISGATESAGKLCQRAVQILGPQPTPDDGMRQYRLNAANYLALVYRDEGKLDLARNLCSATLASAEAIMGPDHELTMILANNLGLIHISSRDLVAAEEQYQRVLSTRLRTLDPDHEQTLCTQCNLAIVYQGQNKVLEAEDILLHTAPALERHFGLEYPRTLAAKTHLALLLTKRGRDVQAMAQLEAVLQARKRVSGERAPATVACQKLLDKISARQSKLKLVDGKGWQRVTKRRGGDDVEDEKERKASVVRHLNKRSKGGSSEGHDDGTDEEVLFAQDGGILLSLTTNHPEAEEQVGKPVAEVGTANVDVSNEIDDDSDEWSHGYPS